MDATISASIASNAASDSTSMDMQAKLKGLSLGGKHLSPEAKEKKLREACEGFESVFIQKMWQEMRNTLPKEGLMHSREEHFWQDMYDQELSKSMTSAGGIGLADMMYKQLSQSLVSASRGTAGMMQGRAFAPAPAPFMPEQPAAQNAEATAEAARPAPVQPVQAAQAKPKMRASDIYERPAISKGMAANAQTPAQAKGPAQTKGAEQEQLTNPEIEKALAALRVQQALSEKADADQQAEPKQAAAQRDNFNGLAMARLAQREAGDKLGSHAVRPPLHAQMPKRAQSPAVKPDQELIRTLNVDRGGPKAGAGLAAYHAAQARMREQEDARAMQAAEAPMPAPLAQGRLQQQAENAVPPLTAKDIHG